MLSPWLSPTNKTSKEREKLAKQKEKLFIWICDDWLEREIIFTHFKSFFLLNSPPKKTPIFDVFFCTRTLYSGYRDDVISQRLSYPTNQHKF
mmetsp:Transcript_13221/g.20390  ORF Transcript_13221/g.20390 Transcript_13221/m.20390 type:complete len:92 (-) Transcript_13221:91-366(-)